MERPGLVIFDCDGVLVDTEHMSNSGIAEYFTGLGVPMSVEEATRRFKGLDNSAMKQQAESAFGIKLPDDFVRITELREQEAAMTADLHSIPGARHAVDGVIASGCPVCVASNGEVAKMEITLGRTGLLDKFGGRLFSKDHVARGKPAPDLFLYAAEQMGFAPPDCVVIEDSAAGVRGAVEAGMRVLGYAPEGDAEGLSDLGAEVFPSMAEVPGLLGF
ncbi:MAG: HAD family phosphatase [Chloroflexi bacterium]|nr:HAD family phosphatase [Chloroflexota bacterium]